MKKSILNLGKSLNKKQQKKINGGLGIRCYRSEDCRGSSDCCNFGQCIDTTHAILEPYCS